MAIYPLFYCLVRFSTTKNYISWNVQGCFIIQLSMFAKAMSQERCLHQFMTTARECENFFTSFCFFYYFYETTRLLYRFHFFLSRTFLFSFFKLLFDIIRRFLRCFSMITCFFFKVKNKFLFFQNFCFCLNFYIFLFFSHTLFATCITIPLSYWYVNSFFITFFIFLFVLLF